MNWSKYYKREAKNKRFYYDKFGKPKDIPGFIPIICKNCGEIIIDPELDIYGKLHCELCRKEI